MPKASLPLHRRARVPPAPGPLPPAAMRHPHRLRRRPEQPTPVTGSDLRAAADAVLVGKKYDGAQHGSMGCNIKWKAGNEPEYAR